MGSPDASAGMPPENFSVRWHGTVLPPTKGAYTFYADGDNRVKLFVNDKLVLNKQTAARGEVSRKIRLAGGQPAKVRVEYVHATGNPTLHIAWSGPGREREIMTPVGNAGVE